MKILVHVLDLLSPRRADERRNVRALSLRLGVDQGTALEIYRRSRQVGFGAAMLEWEERCRERSGPEGADRR